MDRPALRRWAAVARGVGACYFQSIVSTSCGSGVTGVGCCRLGALGREVRGAREESGQTRSTTATGGSRRLLQVTDASPTGNKSFLCRCDSCFLQFESRERLFGRNKARELCSGLDLLLLCSFLYETSLKVFSLGTRSEEMSCSEVV